MSEESNLTENKDTKNPMSVFVKLTVVSLVFTASVMFLFYNFAKFKNVDVGSLGGAFQGTFGVAAAVAGAIVTIQLAKIAIDIAARQARNDDPDFLLAREVKAVFTTMRVSHKIIKSMYKSAENVNAKRLISKNALIRLTESLTSNPIYQFLELETNVTKKDQCIANIGQLLFCIEQMINENECVKKYEDKYNTDSKSAFIAINNVLSDAKLSDVKNEASTTTIKKFDLSYYIFQVINVEKDSLPIDLTY